VQLQAVFEQRLGVELDEDSIASISTLGELRRLVQEQSEGASPAPPNTTAQLLSSTGETRSMEPHNDEATYPHWPWSWPMQLLRIAFIELVMRPLVWLIAAPKVMRDTAVLPAGPLLLIANHVTAYDGALILYALPRKLRWYVAAAMSGEMLQDYRRGRNQGNALLNLLVRPGYWLVTALFNVFPLPRLRGFRRSFAHAGEAMDRGYSVLIFPEGTRSRTGKLQRFRPGIGLLALESRVPIVPMALIGLGPSNARWIRSRHIEIHIGETVPITGEAQSAEITVTLEERMRRLVGPAEAKD